jgi:hypothetical protein
LPPASVSAGPLLALVANAAIRDGFGVPGAQPVIFHARGEQHGGTRGLDGEQDAGTGRPGNARPQFAELQRGPGWTGRSWVASAVCDRILDFGISAGVVDNRLGPGGLGCCFRRRTSGAIRIK